MKETWNLREAVLNAIGKILDSCSEPEKEMEEKQVDYTFKVRDDLCAEIEKNQELEIAKLKERLKAAQRAVEAIKVMINFDKLSTVNPLSEAIYHYDSLMYSQTNDDSLGKKSENTPQL